MEQPSNQSAAILQAYDSLRTARMNAIYYGRKLTDARRVALMMDVLIALGTSATVASAALMKMEPGRNVVLALASIAAILGVVKPFLQLAQRIERASKIWQSNNSAYIILKKVCAQIQRLHFIDEQMEGAISDANHRMDQLAAADEPAPSKRLLEKCYQQVNEEIPAESLWAPTAAAGW